MLSYPLSYLKTSPLYILSSPTCPCPETISLAISLKERKKKSFNFLPPTLQTIYLHSFCPLSMPFQKRCPSLYPHLILLCTSTFNPLNFQGTYTHTIVFYLSVLYIQGMLFEYVHLNMIRPMSILQQTTSTEPT